MTAALRRVYVDEFLALEGSTRAVALVRIASVLLLWSRFGGYTYDPARNLEPDRMLLCALFWMGTPLLLVGLQTRLAAVITVVPAVGAYYWLGVHEGVEPLRSHHVYLHGAIAVLVACTPCDRSFSVDRWLGLRRAEREGRPPPREWGPLWGQRLLAVLVTVLYLTTAWEKSYTAFVDGSALEMAALTIYFGSDVPRFPGFHELTVVASVLTLALEWGLPFGLWWRRTRGVAVVAGFLLHGVIYWFLPVATFTAMMFALYLTFFDPDEVHRATERLA